MSSKKFPPTSQIALQFLSPFTILSYVEIVRSFPYGPTLTNFHVRKDYGELLREIMPDFESFPEPTPCVDASVTPESDETPYSYFQKSPDHTYVHAFIKNVAQVPEIDKIPEISPYCTELGHRRMLMDLKVPSIDRADPRVK